MSAGRIVTVNLLGPVEVSVDDEPVPVNGTKLRAITALLALANGAVVSMEDLLDQVWGEDLPATARNTLQYHVGVLRKALNAHSAGGALMTRDPGYAMTASTDVAVFSARAAAGRQATLGHDHDAASALYVAALDQWRGRAFADLRELEFGETRAVALEQQRLICVESWADAELACGRAESVVAPLQDLLTENPTRERLWVQLMLALYRTGRQDAALSAYRTARGVLDRELGVQPSEALRTVHEQVLRQDPALLPGPVVASDPPVAFRQTTLVRSDLSAAPPTLLGPQGVRVVLAGTPVTIGRQSDCDVVLGDDQASRHHARIAPADQGYAVVDLGSTNGTIVNGVRAEGPVALVDGDRIEVGSSLFRFLSR